jgi:phenylacetate-CoA ligase
MASALERLQWNRLRKLLKVTSARNLFYKEKLSKAGVNLSSLKSLEDFKQRVPLTTKDDLRAEQAAHPPFGRNLNAPLGNFTRFTQTSATSGGVPLRWLDTPESWDWMLGNWERIFKEARLTKKERFFFAFSFGPFLGFWTAFEAASRRGNLCLPGGGLSTLARWKMILDHGVTVLLCTPTYALRMVETAEQEKLDLSALKIKHLIVAGEPGGSLPETRERLKKGWRGAEIIDHHGMTEVGPASFAPHKHSGALEIIGESYLAEVIDPQSLQPVKPGEKGELILTPLGRNGMPVLRYRTGDWVELSKHAKNGRVVLEGGILGRVDDMVTVRGVNVYPSALDGILRSCGGVAEYRVELFRERGMNELKIVLEPQAGTDGAKLAQQAEEAVRTALNLRVPVELAPANSLPRFEMKAVRWVKK